MFYFMGGFLKQTAVQLRRNCGRVQGDLDAAPTLRHPAQHPESPKLQKPQRCWNLTQNLQEIPKLEAPESQAVGTGSSVGVGSSGGALQEAVLQKRISCLVGVLACLLVTFKSFHQNDFVNLFCSSKRPDTQRGGQRPCLVATCFSASSHQVP